MVLAYNLMEAKIKYLRLGKVLSFVSFLEFSKALLEVGKGFICNAVILLGFLRFLGHRRKCESTQGKEFHKRLTLFNKIWVKLVW